MARNIKYAVMETMGHIKRDKMANISLDIWDDYRC